MCSSLALGRCSSLFLDRYVGCWQIRLAIQSINNIRGERKAIQEKKSPFKRANAIEKERSLEQHADIFAIHSL